MMTTAWLFTSGDSEALSRFELELFDLLEHHPEVVRGTVQSWGSGVANSTALHALADSEARSGR